MLPVNAGRQFLKDRIINMYLYVKVFNELKKRILDGAYPSGTFLPSEREIGEEFNIDRTTVRKSLQKLQENNYVIKIPGKGTSVISRTEGEPEREPSPPGQKEFIAFLLPMSSKNHDRISQPFYSQLFFYIDKECNKLGYSLVYSTLNDSDSLETFFNQSNSVINGIIFVSNVHTSHIKYAVSHNIPSIIVNELSDLIPSIVANDFEGALLLCNHLIELGHKKIGVIDGISTYNSSKERMRGVITALARHGLSLDKNHIVGGSSWEFQGGYDATDSLIKSGCNLPTAFIAFNDIVAQGAMQALQNAGFHIPEDISIASFDNSDLAKYATPKLSSIDLNIPYLAKAAALTLNYQFTSQKPLPFKILSPVAYYERESIKPLLLVSEE